MFALKFIRKDDKVARRSNTSNSQVHCNRKTSFNYFISAGNGISFAPFTDHLDSK